MTEEEAKGDLMFGVNVWEAVQYELKRASDKPNPAPDEMLEIIGGCYVTDFGDWVEVAAFSINPRFRRLGIGTYLLKRVIEDYGKTHTICLMVDTDYIPEAPMNHEQLAAWYRRLGFEDGTPYHEGEGWMSRTDPFWVSP